MDLTIPYGKSPVCSILPQTDKEGKKKKDIYEGERGQVEEH